MAPSDDADDDIERPIWHGAQIEYAAKAAEDGEEADKRAGMGDGEKEAGAGRAQIAPRPRSSIASSASFT